MAKPATSRRMSPIASDSLATRAYDAIRDSILTGHFQMGEQIVELRVAEELGISRAPIREAMRRLVEERLVVERPRHGIFVREFTGEDFVDIYNVRIAVESAAVRLVARRQPPLDAVDKTIARMAAAAKRRQQASVVELELTVHQQLCEASGNEYLASIFHSLSGPILMALGLDDAAYENLDDIVAEHPPLLEAIRSGDENVAARALEEHIVSSVGPVLDRLGGNPDALLTSL